MCVPGVQPLGFPVGLGLLATVWAAGPGPHGPAGATFLARRGSVPTLGPAIWGASSIAAAALAGTPIFIGPVLPAPLGSVLGGPVLPGPVPVGSIPVGSVLVGSIGPIPPASLLAG
ncbi:MAG TPA: hypothetical protein VMO88_09885, partial [Acidimicrobiales bacterium]|nr:hypothetical protein [Acidimicrobiales bacterium]